VPGAPPPGISFDRFVRACVAIKTLTEAFQRIDTDRDGWIQINYDTFLSVRCRSLCLAFCRETDAFPDDAQRTMNESFCQTEIPIYSRPAFVRYSWYKLVLCNIFDFSYLNAAPALCSRRAKLRSGTEVLSARPRGYNRDFTIDSRSDSRSNSGIFTNSWSSATAWAEPPIGTSACTTPPVNQSTRTRWALGLTYRLHSEFSSGPQVSVVLLDRTRLGYYGEINVQSEVVQEYDLARAHAI
jgi:hypothetical protein